MTEMNLRAPSHMLIALFFTTLFLTPSPGRADAPYADLLRSLSSRQPVLEAHLLDAARCIGERLDGMIQFNARRDVCGDDVRALAEEENADRRALNQLMAVELGTTAEAIGRQRAERYLDRYPRGVMREIRLADGRTTWWDGYPPPPDIDAVSRVLTLEGARIQSEPSASAPVVLDGIQQYEAVGVLGAAEGDDGNQWYQVTEEYVPLVKPRGWSPKALGWIAAAETIPWRRAVVMQFTKINRPDTLFYRSKESLLDLIRAEPGVRAARIARQLDQFGRASSGTTEVIAREPKVHLKQERAIFYPVLDFYDRNRSLDLRVDSSVVRLLEVAARTRSSGSDNRGGAGTVLMDIVFVMDTTQSMAPYLRDVISATEQFADSNRAMDLQFGFVGYQDSGHGFDYQSQAFTSHTLAVDEFLPILRDIKAITTVVDDDFPEAMLEGIDRALDETRWRENAVRVFFLVGDAPGKETPGFTIRKVWDKAKTQGVRIFSFHIPGTISKAHDPESRRQYKALSAFYAGPRDSTDPQYYFTSIDAKGPEFAKLVLERFENSREDIESVERSRKSGDPLPEARPGSLSELIFQEASLLLADPVLPDREITGWVADKVLTSPNEYALEPMVLLNETELDELAARVKELKEMGEKALRAEDITTIDFWDMLDTHTRMTMVNPAAVDFRDAFSVPLGIDQLPYDSEIMRTHRDEFRNKDRVHDFVNSMSRRLNYYEDLRRNRANKDIWKKLSLGASERVVAVPLDQLP
jgi:serine/threonine-protein kinase PpkA